MMNKDNLLALTVASLSFLIVTAEQDAHSSSTSIPTFSSTHVQTWTLDLDDKTVANDGDDDYTPSPTSFVTSVSTSFHTMVVEENDDDGTYLVGGGVVFSSQLQTQEPNDMRRPESRKPSSSPITKSPIPIKKDDRDINIIAAAAASTDEEREVDEEATEEEKKENINTPEAEEDLLVVSLHEEQDNAADNATQTNEIYLDNTNKNSTSSTTNASYLRQEPSGAEKKVNRWSALLAAVAWCVVVL
mmetsp:Transcript_1169/g.2151  ORF Transcript_1169/g.2151 Transcript_1169/m.2151 type:complete len:245 (+) Transcript_1169:171-905(+)